MAAVAAEPDRPHRLRRPVVRPPNPLAVAPGLRPRRAHRRAINLYWRHLTDRPLGLSQAVWAEDDGTIRAMFELNPTPIAKAAADLMAGRAVGFSVGTSAAYHEWAGILDPDEWAPSEGPHRPTRHALPHHSVR